jgi:hypothetical protein
VQENSGVAWFDWGDYKPPEDFNPHPALAVSIGEAAIPGNRATPIPAVDVLDSLCHWARWEILDREFQPLFP